MNVGHDRDRDELLERLLLSEAKTGVSITVLDHSSHVLQVMRWLLAPLELDAREKNILLLAAALHDVGKAATRPTGDRWPHAGESARLVPALLDHPDFCDALESCGIDPRLSPDEMDRLVRLCREHHGLHARTLAEIRGAPLLVVADALASSLEQGWSGSVGAMLDGRYASAALAALARIGWAPWVHSEIHKVDLPNDSPSDTLFAETLIERLIAEAEQRGLGLVMRDAAQVWFSGSLSDVEAMLGEVRIATADALDLPGLRRLYESGQFPRPPRANMTEIHYFFASDEVACLALQDLMTRRGDEARAAFERHGLTFERLTDGLDAATLSDPLALGQHLYANIRAWLGSLVPEALELLPEDAIEWAIAPCNATNDGVVLRLAALAAERHPRFKNDIPHITGLLRKRTLCRSLVMGIREVVLVREELASREVSFAVSEVAWVDETPPQTPPLSGPTRSKHRHVGCAICRERVAVVKATTMVAGATEGDGTWASAGQRKCPRICAWCHSSALHALPLVTLRILHGTKKAREINYLQVETVLSRDRLAHLLTSLGFLCEDEARDVVSPTNESTAALDEEATDFFLDVLGEVPAESVLLGVDGLLGSRPVQEIAGRILPGRTPLASRAVFVLPSVAFFGQHPVSGLSQQVLDLVALGVMATLRDRIGPARFQFRTSSRHGLMRSDAAPISDAMLERAQAGLAIAEFRRRFLAGPQTGQSPHELDSVFIHDLIERPRETVSRLICEILRADPLIPASKAKILALVCLIDRMVPVQSDPYAALLDVTLRDLMDAKVVPESLDPFQTYAGPGIRMKTNRELFRAFHGFWDIDDRLSLERWAEETRRDVCRIRDRREAERRARLIERVVRRIVAFSAERGILIREITRRLCAQMYLGVFSTSYARISQRKALQEVRPLDILVPSSIEA